MSAPDPTTASTPIDEFSDCHSGMLAKLAELGTLPALLGPAATARRVAAETLRFFNRVLFEHHGDEERELFPAVLASAAPGAERAQVQQQVAMLTSEHREVEAAWKRLAPALERIAKGRDAELDTASLDELVRRYGEHARHEERQFLPLAREILGRNANHLAALGVSLHMRHALPQVLERYGRVL